MARSTPPFYTFSGGEMGREISARATLDQYPSMAETLENFLPEVSGSLMFRPGLKAQVDLFEDSHIIPFVRANGRYGIIMQDYQILIEQEGGIIARAAVDTVITNGTFASPGTGWVDVSEAGANVNFTANGLELESNGTNLGGVYQALSISPDDIGVEHGLRILIERGPVEIRIGTSAGDGDIFHDNDLRKGVHSIAFTPPQATVYLQFQSSDNRRQTITSCDIEGEGDLILPSPYPVDTANQIMLTKEVDVMWLYAPDRTVHPRRLERRGSSSWSLVYKNIEDGPFKPANTNLGHTMQSNGRVGNITLTSSRDFFEADMVEKLIRLNHGGQFVQASVSSADSYTDAVEVTGIDSAREIIYRIEGTFTGTVTLQRSVGNELSYVDVAQYNSPGAYTYNDGNDNEQTYYRIGFKSGDYSSGTADLEIEYNSGQSFGIAKITSVTNGLSAECEVIKDITKTTPTTDWEAGEWSANEDDGYPDVGEISDGRLWTMREEKLWGSKSAEFESHETSDDDSSAIARSLGVGDVQTGRFLLDLIRLVAGCSNGEPEIRSSSFDEVLTASNINVKGMSNVGCARIRPTKIDSRGLFVERSGRRLYETVYDVQSQRYVPRSLMLMHKQIARSGIRQVAFARQPDTRIFCVLENGEVAVKIYEPGENVFGWSRITTDGKFRSVCVLPQEGEDRIVFVVQRTVATRNEFYLEELDDFYFSSREDANPLDSYVRKEAAEDFTVVENLDHLEGFEVGVWADGKRQNTKIVSGGQITMDHPARKACVGLCYTGKYRSPKLPFGAQTGSALGQLSAARGITFTVRDTSMGFQFGSKFEDAGGEMDTMYDNFLSDAWETYNNLYYGVTTVQPIPGDMSRDPRICIQVNAPSLLTVDGFTIIGLDLDERTG